jgi:hypothetical protein
MADLDPSTLFNVKGLVAVVTGGGTGDYLRSPEERSLMPQQVLG